jgi:hypothetical protein
MFFVNYMFYFLWSQPQVIILHIKIKPIKNLLTICQFYDKLIFFFEIIVFLKTL